jgi:hypothetical protein
MEVSGNQRITTIEFSFRSLSTRQTDALVGRSANDACQIDALAYGVGWTFGLFCIAASRQSPTDPRAGRFFKHPKAVNCLATFTGRSGTRRFRCEFTGALQNGRAGARPYRLSDPRFRLIHIASL